MFEKTIDHTIRQYEKKIKFYTISKYNIDLIFLTS